MNRETIQALELALTTSPENTILRKQVALGYMEIEEFELAKGHLNILIQKESTRENKKALAKCFLMLENYTAGLILCEELAAQGYLDFQFLSTYINLLIEDGQLTSAVEKYQFFSATAGYEDPDLEHRLKIPVIHADLEPPETFLEKPDINFNNVGGMNNIKEEIRMKIILPLSNPDLYKAYGKKAGGGILMYGPPGCGKTYLSKATAGEIQSQFMSIGIEEVLDMYIGNSEKNLKSKFESARRNTPCVLFFDEIDALGSKRQDLRASGSRNLINQFLKELDGIDSENEGLLILGATNSPWHMDPAFLRPGRFDRIIFVPPPDFEARIDILKILLEDKPTEKIDLEKLAKKTDGFSGADMNLLIDLAIEGKLKSAMKTGKIEKLTTNDLSSEAKKVRPSTKEWFNTAKNYALYSNSSGLYDDIIKYLKL